MQYVLTIVELIWADLMRQEALPKERRLQSGLRLEHLTLEIRLDYFGKIKK
jgi:hypothetical protein